LQNASHPIKLTLRASEASLKVKLPPREYGVNITSHLPEQMLPKNNEKSGLQPITADPILF